MRWTERRTSGTSAPSGLEFGEMKTSTLSQQRLGLRVGRVVLDELVRRLLAGQAGRPLASVLLAEDEYARLGAVAVRADPVQVLLERATR